MGRRKRHPVGVSTFADAKPSMKEFLNAPVDWVTPDINAGDYTGDPPAATGEKVIISDTDHIFGVGGDSDWVWKSFTRGLNPIYMDPLDMDPARERARRAMGHTRRFAERMNLAGMTPRRELSSTGYCLANPGKEYLVYQPDKGGFTVQLARGTYAAEWFDPEAGKSVSTSTTVGGRHTIFKPPFYGPAVLYLKLETRN
jgi:hypothetical protein